MRRVVTLIGKPGCHLCDEAREMLQRLAPSMDFEIEEINIIDDAALRNRYQYAVPVIRVGDVPLLSGRFGEPDLRREIERAFGTGPWSGVPKDEQEFLPSLQCPICEGDLESRPRAVACLRCGHEFPRRDGVLMLIYPEERPSGKGIMDRIGELISFRLKPPKERR